MKKIQFVITALIFLCSCNTIDLFERTEAFTKHQWPSSQKLNFTFIVNDTVTRYNIFVVLRHSNAYHFNNIWLDLTTVAPADTAQTQKLNLTLGDNKKGWLGAAMDDIIEHRILITKIPVALKQGNYTFTIQQIMREDPLENILNAGIRVEKAIQ